MSRSLAAHLERHDKSRKAFAAEIGVTEPALSRYIRNSQIPTRKIMARIIVVTGGEVTPNDFYDMAPEAAAS